MASVTVQIEIPKETHELAAAIVTVVSAAKQALADGFQPGLDIPAILLQSMSALTVGVQGMDQVGAEMRADLSGFLMAWGLAGSQIAALFATPPSVMPPAV